MNVVRWYSFMQSMAAEACMDLGIAPLTFDYDSINLHMPIPKVMESKKAAKKAEKPAEAPKAEAPKAEEEADISKLESGNANPSLKTLQRLAAGMGMKIKIEFQPMAQI